MKIDLSNLFTALAPSLATKLASQLFGSKVGQQVGASTGAPALSLDQIKALAQPIVDAELATLKPQAEMVLEVAIDTLILKYVPAELQAAAMAEVNAAIEAKVGAWNIKL